MLFNVYNAHVAKNTAELRVRPLEKTELYTTANSPEESLNVLQESPGPSVLSVGNKRGATSGQPEGKRMKSPTFENPLDEQIEKKKIGTCTT